MKTFTDISNFNKPVDYISILSGSLNADLMVLFFVTHNIIKSPTLDAWYKKFGLSAILFDTVILMIGITLARFAYPYVFSEYSLFLFIMLALTIQIIHDFLFYWLFQSVPDGYNQMMDHLKLYAAKVGGLAIVGNSCAMITACLLASHFAGYSFNANIIILITTLYFVPYLIFMS